MKPTLLVLAAGMGSRYGSLKQVDPVGPSGETIIDYSIYDAIRAGFGKVVFVIRKSIEKEFNEIFIKKLNGKIETDYVLQDLDKLPDGFELPAGREKPWGTGHAVLVAKEAIHTPFAVINADDFYGRSAFEEAARFLSKQAVDAPTFCMVGYLLKNTLSEHGSVSRGVCSTNKQGHLTGIVERTKIERTTAGIAFVDEQGQNLPLTGDETVSMNFFGFTPLFFEHLENGFKQFLEKEIQLPKSEYYIPSEVNHQIETGNATTQVLTSKDQWFGVTYKEDRPTTVSKIQELIDQGLYPAKLWE